MGIRVEDSANDGATVFCAACREVVYPDCKVLANHDIRRLPDGRMQWWSRDFETTVHLCELPPVARAVEEASGLVLDFLASRGVHLSEETVELAPGIKLSVDLYS